MNAIALRGGILTLLLVSILLQTACGSKKIVFTGESEPEDFSISNTDPIVFEFEIPDGAKGKFDFAVELTYFENQIQGWESLPLFYILKDPAGKETDHRFSLKIKEPDGKWVGNLLENNADRKTEQNIHDGLSLAAGKHVIRIFGDNQDLSKPILGIVRLTFKVYGGS